jgi:hypothetical protein
LVTILPPVFLVKGGTRIVHSSRQAYILQPGCVSQLC